MFGHMPITCLFFWSVLQCEFNWCKNYVILPCCCQITDQTVCISKESRTISYRYWFFCQNQNPRFLNLLCLVLLNYTGIFIDWKSFVVILIPSESNHSVLGKDLCIFYCK